MSERIDLQAVDSVEITTLCENLVDSMAPVSEAVERRRASASNPVVSKLFAKELATPFEGAHGLSMLIRVTRKGITRTLLFDAGGSTGGLIHNLDCLELNPRDFSCIVLSHGHFDHVLGLVGLYERMGRLAFPVTIHPDAYLERGAKMPNGKINAIGAPSRQGLRDAGLELIEGSAPSLLLEKMALVTGQIARTNDYETGWPDHMAVRNGEWTPDPEICDDQGLVFNVRGKGLVGPVRLRPRGDHQHGEPRADDHRRLAGARRHRRLPPGSQLLPAAHSVCGQGPHRAQPRHRRAGSLHGIPRRLRRVLRAARRVRAEHGRHQDHDRG